MNVQEISRALVSGTVVYVVMASCSPSTGVGPSARLNGDAAVGPSSGGAMGAGGAVGTGGGIAAGGMNPTNGGPSIVDAAIDRLAKPVPDAHAQAVMPISVTVPCAPRALAKGGAVGYTYFFAEAKFPGKSVADLARVVAVVHYIGVPANPPVLMPTGYEDLVVQPWIADGSALASCDFSSTSTTTIGTVSGVTFTLPP